MRNRVFSLAPARFCVFSRSCVSPGAELPFGGSPWKVQELVAVNFCVPPPSFVMLSFNHASLSSGFNNGPLFEPFLYVPRPLMIPFKEDALYIKGKKQKKGRLSIRREKGSGRPGGCKGGNHRIWPWTFPKLQHLAM